MSYGLLGDQLLYVGCLLPDLEYLKRFSVFARSAFTFGSAKSEMFVLLRPFVRKIIHFCEGEMEGPRIVLPTGSLTHRFFRIRKVDPPKLVLATGIGRFRDPFFERKKVAFLEKKCKKWS